MKLFPDVDLTLRLSTPGTNRWTPRLIAGIVFVLSLALSAGVLWRWDAAELLAQRQQAARLAQSHSIALQRNVERMLSKNYALAALVHQGHGTIANFEEATAQLLLTQPRVQALSLSPDGVVRHVAPVKGNEMLLGFDQLRDPDQRREADFTRDTARLTLAGPMKLTQGGLGVVSRLPISLNIASEGARFWGFANVAVLLRELLDGVALSDLTARGYAYELWRLQTDSGLKQVIASSEAASMQEPVRQSLEVPNGAWNLDMAPVKGWGDARSLAAGAGIGLVASLLLAYLAHLFWQQRVSRAGLEATVAARTAEILATRNQLQSTLDAIHDPIFEIGLDGRYYSHSEVVQGLLPPSIGSLVGKTVFDVLPDAATGVIMDSLRAANVDGRAQGQQFALTLPQGMRWFELSVARKAVESGQAPRFVVMSRDITERKIAEQEVRRLAFYDPLTALPNRRLLQDRLDHALAATGRSHHQGALLLIDLDNFKALNDTVGHDKGDLLLQQVAHRLLESVRECDTVARLGGDEFVVMIADLGPGQAGAVDKAKTVAEKIVARLSQPYDIAGRAHRSSTSIGVALFGAYTRSGDETLKRSDVAMYQAKAAGRNTLRFFDPEMQVAVDARAALESDVRDALASGQFRLHYQPQVGPSGEVVGAEALLRWTHPVRGLVEPAEFIPVAEQSGLVLQLGQWVLETACAQLARWAGQPAAARLTLAVNVSVHQFRQPNFVDQVLAAIQGSGADARRLKLEITESMFAYDLEDIIAKMTELKAVGVAFSLDDFGTGYSSLSYLKRLPLDQLKIDQSFVRDVLTDPNDAAIARTIVALAQSLGLEVIAEGVETEGQREFLALHGCNYCQGYLFSRPLPPQEFDRFLQNRPD